MPREIAPVVTVVTWLVLVASSVGVLACLWAAWCEFPFYAWNDIRLAPAFGLRLGLNPYPLIGEGPLFTWIYGPVGIFVNLPATFAGSACSAVRICGLINAALVLGPLAVIFFSSEELRIQGKPTCLLAFALGILLVPGANLILHVADHTAIACGLLASWLLVRHPTVSGRTLMLATVAVALAIWAKQIAIFLPIAHLVYLCRTQPRRAVWAYANGLVFFLILFLTIFAWEFGFANLWLNLVVIPQKLGWADIPSRFSLRAGMLIAQIALPLLGLLLVRLTHRWPDRKTQSARFFEVSVLAFFTMLPIGLLAYFKAGGDINLLHSWDYLMPALLLLWLGSSQPFSAGPAQRIMVTLGALLIHAPQIAHPSPRPFTAHFAVAQEIMAAHPHRTWFPQNPVITLYADHQLWHTEDGVSTRYLADYGIREVDFIRHLPPHLEALAYPIANNAPFSLHLLQDFTEKTRYPYWMVYTQAGSGTEPSSSTPALPHQ